MSKTLKSIGYIETPYKNIKDCPRNIDLNGPVCRLVIDKEYAEGITGLKQGQKIVIIYWFDGVDRNLMMQTSKNSGEHKGVFALRSPNRPNPIGVSELFIEDLTENTITVKGLDCLNKTPLIDIKPSMKEI